MRTGKALEREEAAHRRLRRMRMLPLTQMGWKRVLPSFVGSLWYGMEYRPLSASLRVWHRDIKTLVHGRARVTANWKLVQVFGLPSFSLLPECIHWSCSWSGVWRLANYEPTRHLLLNLWNSRKAPRSWRDLLRQETWLVKEKEPLRPQWLGWKLWLLSCRIYHRRGSQIKRLRLRLTVSSMGLLNLQNLCLIVFCWCSITFENLESERSPNSSSTTRFDCFRSF